MEPRAGQDRPSSRDDACRISIDRELNSQGLPMWRLLLIADETLQRWRYKVALWADMPPAPPVGILLDAAREALKANLDAATVPKELHRLEMDSQVASGSKFATFAGVARHTAGIHDHGTY